MIINFNGGGGGTDIQQVQELINSAFTAYKTTSITSGSTDNQFPTAKAVYEKIGGIADRLSQI